MKISLNWLTDYLDISLGADELAMLLTNIGLNCDSVNKTDSDIVFDLDVTSNRPDWLGHLGVARELAAVTGATLRRPKIGPLPSGRGSQDGSLASELTGVHVEAPDLCPRYIARVIRGVKVGPSPAWLVERLAAVGMRSINNVVDVTNFVLMEYSQPLHSFDYDKLTGHCIVVRRARDGEILQAIDGSKCELNHEMLVIADAALPVAIAGVMGGLNSEVSEGTTDILLESAQFDPMSVRRTSRRLQLMSDSNYRFERGVDPMGVDEASLRACQLIVELAGGQVAQGSVDVWANPAKPWQLTLRPERTTKLLGLEIPAQRQTEILSRLGLGARLEGGKIVCTIPTFRQDLTREVDLIEEVARLEGLDKIPVSNRITHAVSAEGVQQRTRRELGQVLVAAGFDEAMTPTFVNAGENELFGLADPIAIDTRVRKTNNALRGTLLPSLLGCCKTNQDAGIPDLSVFELAKVFPRDTDSARRPSLAAASGDGGNPQTPPSGLGGATQAHLPREFTELAMMTTRDLRFLRGAMEVVIQRLAPKAKVEFRTREQAALPFAPGASAEIFLDGKPAGDLGMIDAAPLSHYGLEKPLAAGRLNFEMLLAYAGTVRQYTPVPRFPAVLRDLSLVVNESVTWQQIEQAVASANQPMRVGLEYVVTYRGKPIPPGSKSVTITLTYRSNEGTLRGEQVDEQVQQVVASLQRELAAEIRK